MSLNKEQKAIAVDLIEALLTDDNGVSEEAYDRLVEFFSSLDEPKLVDWIRKADATDGRFYFPL